MHVVIEAGLFRKDNLDARHRSLQPSRSWGGKKVYLVKRNDNAGNQQCH
jgi:hypothetical protein